MRNESGFTWANPGFAMFPLKLIGASSFALCGLFLFYFNLFVGCGRSVKADINIKEDVIYVIGSEPFSLTASDSVLSAPFLRSIESAGMRNRDTVVIQISKGTTYELFFRVIANLGFQSVRTARLYIVGEDRSLDIPLTVFASDLIDDRHSYDDNRTYLAVRIFIPRDTKLVEIGIAFRQSNSKDEHVQCLKTDDYSKLVDSISIVWRDLNNPKRNSSDSGSFRFANIGFRACEDEFSPYLISNTTRRYAVNPYLRTEISAWRNAPVEEALDAFRISKSADLNPSLDFWQE